MIIPEKVLEKQICYSCKKYLSVEPVKVYPNREVKCGRCSTTDDLGVTSTLFSLITKEIQFPCINRYDGCNAMINNTEMILHEIECPEEEYECFLCSSFKGSAYELNSHCQQVHNKDHVINKEFWIDFDNGSRERTLWHRCNSKLFFLRYICDLESLHFEMKFVGHHYEGNMFYSIRLYDIRNELQCMSRQLPCTTINRNYGERASLKWINSSVLICRFFIHDEPKINLEKALVVIDDTSKAFTLKCTFDNWEDIVDDTEYFYPGIFHMAGISFRILTKKKLSLTDYRKKICIFLACHQIESCHSSSKSCQISATFKLISHDWKTKISRSFEKRDFDLGKRQGIIMHDWNYIIDPNRGFLKNNQVQVETTIRIHFFSRNIITCDKCQRNCIYCNDD